MTYSAELIWFVAGLALMLLEFVAPGVIFVFFGVGAWITAITTWAGITTTLPVQLLVWAVTSVLSLVALRRRLSRRFTGFESDRQDPMSNLDEYRGAEVTVLEAISGPDHRGRVEFKGAEWDAASTVAIAAGRRAIVSTVDGLTLHVRPLDENRGDS